jgi:hypothetical protein
MAKTSTGWKKSATTNTAGEQRRLTQQEEEFIRVSSVDSSPYQVRCGSIAPV